MDADEQERKRESIRIINDSTRKTGNFIGYGFAIVVVIVAIVLAIVYIF